VAITKNEFHEFIEKHNDILSKYSSALEHKDLIFNFAQNKEFIKQNDKMFMEVAWFLNMAPDFADKIEPEALKNHLDELEKFVEEWKTRPISCWLFKNPRDDLIIDFLKEALEYLFEEISQYHFIKVYPWTTKKEIDKNIELIREKHPKMPLRPELYLTNFKIKALRDAGWNYTEIMKFLEYGWSGDQEIQKQIESRTKELQSMGKTKVEIDDILDEEFPYTEYDNLLSEELDYDAVRKRRKATEDLLNKFIQYFKIGK